MLNYLWPLLIICSFIYAIMTGKVDELNKSVFSSLEDVISLSMTLVGTTCLWCGLMEIVKRTSLMEKIVKFLKPIITFLFPDSKHNKEAMENISMNITSNILGLGNAATPAGLSAMEKLQESNREKEKLSDSMMMLIVLNTTSIQLIPTTVIAIRSALNSVNPSNIILPIWISTIIGSLTGIIVTKIFIKGRKNK